MQRFAIEIIQDQRGSLTDYPVSDPLGRWPGTITYKPTPIPLPTVSDESLYVLEPTENTWKSPIVDKESFNKIRRSGRIKMTRYSRGKQTTRHYVGTRKGLPLVRTDSWTAIVHRWGEYTRTFWPGQVFEIDYLPGYPPYTHYSITAPPNSISYRINERFTLQSLSLPVVDLRKPVDFETQVEQVKSDVSTALHKRWDVLTDMLEGKKTYTMMADLLKAAINPLSSFNNLRKKIRKKPFKGSDKFLREKWLEYRYGITPLMLSIQDASKLLDELKYEYVTERCRETVDVLNDEDIPNVECIFIKHFGTVSVSATAKGRFENRPSRFGSGISLNLANSLWEIIPYSLVVDWFVNVGDFLYNRSSALIPPTFESAMCYAVRRNITTHTYARIKNLDGSFSDQLLLEEGLDTYERVPFNQSDIQLVFNPRLSSWKRWLDAYALGVGLTTQTLKRLR